MDPSLLLLEASFFISQDYFRALISNNLFQPVIPYNYPSIKVILSPELANLPPSNGTNGLNSGGVTGRY